MKFNNSAFLTGLLMVSLTFSSCLETHVTNTVMSNGSVLRTVVCKSDNIDDFDFESYPVPVDETWRKKVTFEIDTIESEPGIFDEGSDTTWIYTYERKFNSVGAINEMYESGIDKYQHTKRTVAFEKEFRWFFSNVIFQEKIEPLIVGIDPKEYFSEDEYVIFGMQDHELAEYINHPDSIERKKKVELVEDKVDDWMTESLIEDYLKRLASYANNASGSIDSLQVMEVDVDLKISFEDESGLREATEMAFNDDLEVLFGTDVYDFFDNTELLYERLFEISGSGYTMDFIMPGTLTDANGAIIDKNLVRWSVASEDFFATPYVMQAESRVINIWAWIVSAIFVLFVLMGLLRNKKSA